MNLRLERLFARESEQAFGQLGAADRGFDNGRRKLVLFADTTLQQLCVAQHDRQQIIEIVRHAAGQLADCIHLLGLPQFGFGLALFGDVGGNRADADDLAIAAAHREFGDDDRVCGVIIEGDFVFVFAGMPGLGDEFFVERQSSRQISREKVANGGANRIARGDTEEYLEAFVGQQDAAVEVTQVNRRGGVRHQIAEALFALFQRGDIGVDGDQKSLHRSAFGNAQPFAIGALAFIDGDRPRRPGDPAVPPNRC